MKLTSSHRLYILGVILLVALAIGSLSFSRRGELSFLIPLVVAGITYLLAIRELFSTPNYSRRVIVFGLVLATAWQLLFLLKPPGADDDIHRYVWDGRVQRLGYNPYLLVPSDPALASLHTSETRALNNPDLPSPYPPGAQLFFRAVTAIHESVFVLKVAFVFCNFAIVFILLDLLRRTHQPAHWILAYAWHPLLAIEVAGSGHIDILGVLLLVISVASIVRRCRAVAAVTFGLAVAVKFLPIVLLPLYWKRVRLRDGALAAAVVGLLYVPFLDHGRIPIGSLGTYVQSFRFNGPVFAMLERGVAPWVLALLAVLAGILTAIWMRRRSEELSPDAVAWPMAATLLFAPVVYPWYLLWLLPFMRSVSTIPIMIWTISILPTYYIWYLRTTGRPWLVPGWMMLLEYGAAVVAATLIALRGTTRPAGLQRPADQAE